MDVKRVAALTGHMVDEPTRPIPRFPENKVDAVRLAIHREILKSNIGWGFSSAARGADVLFLEELLKLSGHARVYLPFPRKDFERTSVGYGWNHRFEAVLGHNRVEVIELAAYFPTDKNAQNAAYATCNATLLEAASARAKQLGQDPILIAVWDGKEGGGQGGTADAILTWRQKGYEVNTIQISEL